MAYFVQMRLSWIAALAVSSILPASAFGQGIGSAGTGGPSSLCRSAIRNAEHAVGPALPANLLGAIAVVESGRRRVDTGRIEPWPWTINAEGVGAFYETKAAAIAAVQALQARDVRSIDVGCMQINLMHHPDAFASLEQAFDPQANANYGARFLSQLRSQTGDWIAAAGIYHSATPNLAADYRRLVLAVWPGAGKNVVDTTTQLVAAWRSLLPTQPAVGAGRGVFIPIAWETASQAQAPSSARAAPVAKRIAWAAPSNRTPTAR